ncbi:hypothetical protein JZ751_029043 [Albula glossodonta]|uniref:Glutathione S-transferase LANCL1 n=1 Tax=Albula glossodonta TaxID=121402 RepID=A0A8T2PAH8_9TELE|nr:hypothetical protein JZ751_029043 [Albula glossodonta]
MDKRFLKNPYADYDGSAACTQHLFDPHGKLTEEFAGRLSNTISELLSHMENGLKSADPRDCTGYTGWCGIALLYLHLADVFRETSFLQRALDYASRSLQCLTRRSVTFLLLQLHRTVVKGERNLPDELLYGRIGYLFSLVFINQQFGQEKVPMQYMQEICDAILASGENLSKKCRGQDKTPLLYEWYQEYYVGAAHGLAGIYYFLMQPGFGVGDERLLRLVKPSMDYLCHLKFPSGNYPPCIGDSRDELVHWCHGSPGVIYMLLQAHKVYGDDRYLADALECGQVIWQRGLLKKGYGLCHGAAGNAYAFLALYKHTHNPHHLYRACKVSPHRCQPRGLEGRGVRRAAKRNPFAEWCMDYGRHGCRTPDTPFSLFEGMAGTIYFLADLLQPLRSKFPAFEI